MKFYNRKKKCRSSIASCIFNDCHEVYKTHETSNVYVLMLQFCFLQNYNYVLLGV